MPGANTDDGTLDALTIAIATQGSVLRSVDQGQLRSPGLAHARSADATELEELLEINSPPVATIDVATTCAALPVQINVLANDSDPDNDPLQITIVGQPANGNASVFDNGTPDDFTDDQIVYVPAANFEGLDSFTYQVDDGNGEVSDDTPVIIQVNACGEGAPVITNPGDQDNYEEDTLSLQIEASDPNEDVLTYSIEGVPSDLGIDSYTGVISGTVAVGAASMSPYITKVSVTDGVFVTSALFLWQVKEKGICKVDDVKLITKAADVPKVAADLFKDVTVKGEAQVTADLLGAYSDPKGTGFFHSIHWVYFEGKNLADCEFKRFISRTAVIKGEKFEVGGGFQGAGKKIDATKQADGPNPIGVRPKTPTTFVAVADAPGLKSLEAADYPATYDANFYVFAKSKTDSMLKAEIWYDTNIKATAPKTADPNKSTFTDKKIH